MKMAPPETFFNLPLRLKQNVISKPEYFKIFKMHFIRLIENSKESPPKVAFWQFSTVNPKSIKIERGC